MTAIVITPEEIRPDEAELISAMLQMGISRVHLRHPAARAEELHNIIVNIPLEYRDRLTLHDHFELTPEFHEIGVNLNRRNPEPPECRHGKVSRSCHTIAETFLTADYCLLSPIFPSISKKGYIGEFSDEDLMMLPPNKVFALGGIDSERIKVVMRYPFSGVAVLGAVWTKDTNPGDVIRNVAKILERL